MHVTIEHMRLTVGVLDGVICRHGDSSDIASTAGFAQAETSGCAVAAFVETVELAAKIGGCHDLLSLFALTLLQRFTHLSLHGDTSTQRVPAEIA